MQFVKNVFDVLTHLWGVSCTKGLNALHTRLLTTVETRYNEIDGVGKITSLYPDFVVTVTLYFQPNRAQMICDIHCT